MEYREYEELYSGLGSSQDIEKFIGKGYAPALVKVLFIQKVNRDVKKRFYVVKKKIQQLFNGWKGDQSIIDVASKFNFPPLLVAMFLFQERGVTKREFWRYVKDPYGTLDVNTAKMVKEAVERDIVYSPAANAEGRRRGIHGEELLHSWLDKQGIVYRTENDLKGICKKTPDVLFEEPMEYNGEKVCWMESKASFGDNIEVRRDSKKQLIPYVEAFGPGVVIYWAGHLDNVGCPAGVRVCDASIMNGVLNTYR